MSKADDSREGLAALFADVLSEGAPDPALLVRYADDPSALSPEERQMVESRLAESPQVRDQLEVLKRFDFPVEQPSEEKSNSWLAEALGRIRRLFESRPLLVGVPAIAVAALALLMIYPSAFSIFPPDRSSEPASESVPELLADEPSAPSTVQVADSGKLSPDQIPVAPIAGGIPRSIVVAVVAKPEYRAPQGAMPRLRSAQRGQGWFADLFDPGWFSFGSFYSSPERQTDGVSVIMPIATGESIIALAPEHVGQTASEAPSLYWYLSEIPEAGGFEFWIGSVDANSVRDQPSDAPAGEIPGDWIRKDLPSPARPGLQRILLSDYGVELEAGVDYAWIISSGPDAHASSWIKRVELPASVAKRLTEASLGDVPAIYAEAGLWYDALSSLLEIASDHPNNESVRAARLELLRQGGLEAIDEALAEQER